MITAFTVKNFKAIGDDPVRIELKPITLLFGANSAGKSSILHALNYAYSIFVDHNLNAEYNAHSDSSFNLGRFDRFVHKNSKSRSIVLRFDLNFQAEADITENILINWNKQVYMLSGVRDALYQMHQQIDPRKILDNVKTAYVEVEISWSYVQKHPYVCRYETGLDDEKIATIYADDNRKKNIVLYCEKEHTVCEKFAVAIKDSFDLNWLENYEFFVSPCDINTNLSLYQKDALPSFKENLTLGYENQRGFDSLVKRGILSDYDEFSYMSFESTKVAFEDLLTSILVAPGNKVADWLKNICYLGPLREIPSRHFLGEISNESIRRRWEKGIGAWDFIYKNIGQLQLDQSQILHGDVEDIRAWLKENFEKYHMEILNSVQSDPKHNADFDKYLHDLPDAALFYKKLEDSIHEHSARLDENREKIEEIFKKTKEISEKYPNGNGLPADAWVSLKLPEQPRSSSGEDFSAWEKENLEKYLKGLPAYALVSLNLPGKSSSLRESTDRLLFKINDWLASDQRLNTGYKIFIEQFREISSVIFKDFDEEKSQENVFVLLKEILNEPEIIRIWLHDISRSINLKPHEIGTGISQVLPVVVAAVGVYNPLVVIEQPELHIHPAMQVQLGDLFITQSGDNKFFLIETHSEHLLLRILRRIRETTEEQASDEVKILPNQVAIYYVESENGNTQVNRIGLDENGRFTDRWPKGFFAERMQEMLPSEIRERVEAKRRGKI